MKILKNTCYDVYRYMNSEDFSFIKYPNTSLLLSFNVKGYNFEARKTKDGKTLLVSYRNMVIDKITPDKEILAIFESEDSASKKLNWNFLCPEYIEQIDKKIDLIINS
jgi:hypothetical protein